MVFDVLYTDIMKFQILFRYTKQKIIQNLLIKKTFLVIINVDHK